MPDNSSMGLTSVPLLRALAERARGAWESRQHRVDRGNQEAITLARRYHAMEDTDMLAHGVDTEMA